MIAKKTSKKAPEEKKFLYFQSWVRICEDPFLHKASKHTDLSGCSNSVQRGRPRSLLPSLRRPMTTAQQQHYLISDVFLNLGCQGSLVGVYLLSFF